MEAVSSRSARPTPPAFRTATLRRGLLSLALQVLLLAAALVVLPWVPLLPQELAGLHHYGPYLALTAAGIIALSFNRGRPILALGLLAFAYALYARAQPFDTETAVLLSVLLPLNLAAIALMRERGIASRFALRRVLALAVEGALVLWLLSSGLWHWACQAWPAFVSPAFVFSLSPLVGAALCVATLVTAGVIWLRGNAIDASLFAVVIASEAGAILVGTPHAFGLMIGAAAAVITVGVLQDAYRYAFIDELTGLGARRALNEKLLTLGDRFAIAMVDVDHFKRVNDAHGHDTGDQVLRMIASHLERTGSGARAYRYGGEEFAVVFPDRGAKEVLPALERLRVAVEAYRLQVRTAERRDDRASPVSSRKLPPAPTSIRVTISIGLAENDSKQHRSPDDVVRSADAALYRAKERGRNRLSR